MNDVGEGLSGDGSVCLTPTSLQRIPRIRLLRSEGTIAAEPASRNRGCALGGDGIPRLFSAVLLFSRFTNILFRFKVIKFYFNFCLSSYLLFS